MNSTHSYHFVAKGEKTPCRLATIVVIIPKRDCTSINFNVKSGIVEPLVLPLHFVPPQIPGFGEGEEVEAADFVALVGCH